MSTNALEFNFGKAGDGITCEDCQAALRARIQEVCQQWSEVKVCIFCSTQVLVVRVKC